MKMGMARVFAMILIVASHVGGGITYPMQEFFPYYFFFLTIFVFSSGYFYKKECDSQRFTKYLWKKIKTLLIPYFVWNVVYGLLNLFLRKMNIVDFGDPINLYSLFVRPWIDGHQYHFNVPAWFILSLFIVCIVNYSLRKILNCFHIMNEYIYGVLAFLIGCASIYVAECGYNSGLYMCLCKAGQLFPFFQLGFIYRQKESFFQKHPYTVWIITFVIQLAFVLKNENIIINSVFAVFSGNPILINIIELNSIISVLAVCDILKPAFAENKVVSFFGRNTYSVMMHHPFWIFVLNYTLFLFRNLLNISGFDVNNFRSGLWYSYTGRYTGLLFLYVLFAVAMPLLCKWFVNFCILKINSKSELFLKKNR